MFSTRASPESQSQDYHSAPQAVTGSGHGQDGLQVAQWSYDRHQPSTAKEGSEKIEVYQKQLQDYQQKRVGTLANMKKSTFWLILGLVSIIIIGVSVGGAVGGTMQVAANNGNSQSSASTSSPPSSATTLPSPTRDCPDSDGTTFKSAYTLGSQGAVPETAGLHFVKHCSTGHPGNTIASGYVQSFNHCIELCASLNFWAKNRRCVSVDYRFQGAREPNNCWAHNSTTGSNAENDIDSAILV
ncbi:hypothetical protein MFIFM68171_01984 [Madurella fahalii]|uniref:Apple domain-containing protein n=1 Tax=Madurella fahalii TaxID=1157608 RepID=A0ABQ0G266_9PEZI